MVQQLKMQVFLGSKWYDIHFTAQTEGDELYYKMDIPELNQQSELHMNLTDSPSFVITKPVHPDIMSMQSIISDELEWANV